MIDIKTIIAVEETLKNNENASNKELKEYFKRVLKLTEKQTEYCISQRERVAGFLYERLEQLEDYN